MREAVAVVHELPATRKALQARERGEVHSVGAQQLVRRFGVERKPETPGVAREARARKKLEQVHLHLGRMTRRHQRVEAICKRGFVFAGKAENEVGMDSRACRLCQETQISERGFGVGAASDRGCHARVQRLDAGL